MPPDADSVDARSREWERRACHFHERELEETPERIGELIHDDAEMRLLVSRLQPLRGRKAIVESLARVRESSIYSAKIEHTEWLDERTLLIKANARYAEEEGISTSRVWWLDEFLDGLLYRVQAFKTEVEARDEYRALHPDSRPEQDAGSSSEAAVT